MSVNRKYNRKIRKLFRETYPERADEVYRRLAFTLYKRITLRNPVDTGRSRASWNINAGSPDLTVEPASFSGGEVKASQVVASKGLGFVSSKANTNQEIFISNNLPYIKALENGHSGQAPLGFVSTAVDSVVAEAEAGLIQ